MTNSTYRWEPRSSTDPSELSLGGRWRPHGNFRVVPARSGSDHRTLGPQRGSSVEASGLRGTPDEVAALIADGIEAGVERLLDPSVAPAAREPKRERGEIPYGGEALNLWFHHLASTSPTPAIERLMWFWHGHFATSMEKVEWPDLMHRQPVTLRRYGLGLLDDLLLAMTHDPAMNAWLDLHLSIAGRPNENYARELMELFSMGSGKGYTQRDVVEAARALTGVRARLPHGARPPDRLEVETRVPRPWRKTVLGATGNLDGDDVIGLIVERPECHRFHRQSVLAPLRRYGRGRAPVAVPSSG